jgi:hypothetical protein
MTILTKTLTKTLTLRRIDQNDDGTFGLLVDEENRQLAVTLELPWRENQHDISCVPAGVYPLHRRMSPKHHCEVFELENVPERANIELHIGNFIRDSLGCLLLGTKFATLDGEHGISGSRVAFDHFMDAMKGIEHATLTILDPDTTASPTVIQ